MVFSDKNTRRVCTVSFIFNAFATRRPDKSRYILSNDGSPGSRFPLSRGTAPHLKLLLSV